MSGFKKFLYYFLYPASLIFTVFSLVFYILSSRLSSDSATKSYAAGMLVLFAYACLVALFSQVFRTKLPLAARALIHYALIAASLLVFLLASETFSVSSKLLILGIFTAVYAVIAVPVLIVLYRKKASENAKSEYKSSFSGKK